MLSRTIVQQQQIIEDQTFVGANIQIDSGVAYIRCRFVNCTIIINRDGAGSDAGHKI